MQSTVKIIADSINPDNIRITSILAEVPRYILAEINTHRAFSRNSASSRAIPHKTMIDRIIKDPFVPSKWMKNHPGMQGTEYFNKSEIIDLNLEYNWLQARDYALSIAENLNNVNLTKQITNRLLEPFMMHRILITATEWENFFALRAEDGADIHFQEFAYEILKQMNDNTPKSINWGEWHIPFGNDLDIVRLTKLHDKIYPTISIGYENPGTINDLEIKIATARCARTSYINNEGKDDYEADIKLHDGLLSRGHMSPFEHCAMADPGDKSTEQYKLSNFHPSWLQYRKTINNENRSEPRLIQKTYNK